MPVWLCGNGRQDRDIALTVAQELLDGFTATIGQEPASVGLEALATAEIETRAELEAFASDLTMRRVLGATYHKHLLEREAAVKAASDSYRAACKAAEGAQKTYTADDLEDDPGAVGELLGGLYSVRVRPGRGLKIEDRVTLVPLDGDGVAREATA